MNYKKIYFKNFKMKYILISFFFLPIVACFHFQMSLDLFKNELADTALNLSKKGILAMDESMNTIGKRFQAISLENNIINRQAYRQLLLTTPYLENYISGVILFEETLFQNHTNGASFVSCLQDKNIIPGIKVDKGLNILYGGCEKETTTLGLDDLHERARKYYQQGARFAKWRALFPMKKDKEPSTLAIKENSWLLGRYARIVQEAGLVPIVECEVSLEGEHSIQEMSRVQDKILKEVYHSLSENKVFLPGTLLKPSITIQGLQNKNIIYADKVAKMTLENLEKNVPCSVPGVMFLSGGLSEYEASMYLNRINCVKKKHHPWSLSFSYGRALQNSCLTTWNGKKENEQEAQEKLLLWSKKNHDAKNGHLK